MERSSCIVRWNGTREIIGSLFLIMVALACTAPRYAYHSNYKLTGCGTQITRERIVDTLMRRGFLRSSETKGPYDVFHKPSIVKKGSLAREPYEDQGGDIGVAVCGGGSESYIISEELRSCTYRNAPKDCTKENQQELRKIAEELGCQVEEKAGHSRAWNLEDRQDWTRESCSFIATNLQP